MSSRRSVLSLLVVSIVVQAARSQEKEFSGPQPGERLSPFKVVSFSGPPRGSELTLFADEKGKPTLVVFVHEVTRPGFQLMRPLDHYASKLAANGFDCHFVWLTDDRSKADSYLAGAQRSLNLKSPISISLDGLEGPGNYGLNRKMTLTILVAKENKVTANFAIIQPNETDAPPIIEAMAAAAGVKPPAMAEIQDELRQRRTAYSEMSPQGAAPQLREVLARTAALEAQIEVLIRELNAARVKIAKLEGNDPPPAIEVRKSPIERPRPLAAADLPGRTPQDQELIALMRRMIQPDNDEAKATEIAATMKKWAGDDAARKKDLADFCVRIAHLGYGGPPAKKLIKEMAGNLPFHEDK